MGVMPVRDWNGASPGILGRGGKASAPLASLLSNSAIGIDTVFILSKMLRRVVSATCFYEAQVTVGAMNSWRKSIYSTAARDGRDAAQHVGPLTTCHTVHADHNLILGALRSV